MRLAKTLPFLIYHCAARIVMLPEKLSCIESIVFFGFEPLEMRRLMSSIEYSFENNRRILGQLMKSIDSSVTMMDYVDKLHDKLQGVHDEFRKQAMSIPILWEENENLLLQLVSTSKINITYGITAASSSEKNDKELEEKKSEEQPPDRKSKRKAAKSSETSEKSNGRMKDASCLPPPSYDSLEQILVHLCRDWSSQGEVIRQRLYINGIIPRLLENLPINDVGGLDSNLNGCTGVKGSSDHPATQFLAQTLACDTQLQYDRSIAADEELNFRDDHYEGIAEDEIGAEKVPTESLQTVRNVKEKTFSGRADVSNPNKQSSIPSPSPAVSRDQCGRREGESTFTSQQAMRNSLGIRVLVPGAGLGRLASEIAARGYAVEANDCSGMFHTSLLIAQFLFFVVCILFGNVTSFFFF